jgi:hypothetical protein
MITFKEFLSEQRKEKVDFDVGKEGDVNYYKSKFYSGPHHIETDFNKHHDKTEHNIDFSIDNAFSGSGSHIPPHHKAKLLRHLQNSFTSYMDQETPHERGHSLIFKTMSSDEERKTKIPAYRNAAKLVAKKYGGRYEEHPLGGVVNFSK